MTMPHLNTVHISQISITDFNQNAEFTPEFDNTL